MGPSRDQEGKNRKTLSRWTPWASQVGGQNPPKIDQKSIRNLIFFCSNISTTFDRLGWRFWTILASLKSVKTRFSLQRGAFFEDFGFYNSRSDERGSQTLSGLENGAQVGAMLASKSKINRSQDTCRKMMLKKSRKVARATPRMGWGYL